VQEPKEVRPVVELELVLKIKEKYPEVKGLTATGVIDWALRYLLKLENVYLKKET